MTESQRIGELLSRIIPLTQHDIEEILHEQAVSNRRFGDIAMGMGLCKPEHVWRAWLDQLEHKVDRIRIDQIGVDAQTLSVLPKSLAERFKVLPLRSLPSDLLIACASIPKTEELAEIERVVGRRVKLVLADNDELIRAIDRYYRTSEAA